MFILQPHFTAYPTLVIPSSSSFALSAPSPPPIPFNVSSFELAVVPSSFISCSGTDFRVLLTERVKINNIISTLSQFSINDFEVCLSRHINHRSETSDWQTHITIDSCTHRKHTFKSQMHLLTFSINSGPKLNIMLKGLLTNLQRVIFNSTIPLSCKERFRIFQFVICLS